MKKLIAALAFLASVSTVALAQQESAAEAVSGPAMAFEATTIDYGKIEQNSDPYRSFVFKNTGTEPVVIKHAKGSCGCTVPTYPKEPILPGETGEIKVRYDTKRLGAFKKTVTLTTNAPEERVTLIIQGEVLKQAPQPAGLPAKESNPFNGGK